MVCHIFLENFEYSTSQDAEVTGSGAEVAGSGVKATGSSAEATGSVRTMEPAGSDVDLVRTETKQIASQFFVFFLSIRTKLGTALSNGANGVI